MNDSMPLKDVLTLELVVGLQAKIRAKDAEIKAKDDEIKRLYKNRDRFFNTVEWFEKVVIDKDAEIERLKEVMMDTWGWLDKNNLGTTAHGARLLKKAQ